MKFRFYFLVSFYLFALSSCGGEKTQVVAEHHKKHIRRTIELAKKSRERGDNPYGALLVHNGKVVMEMNDAVISDHDATQHAETRLVSHASKKFSRDFLKKCTLYTSTEPCVMCSGAIFWGGIKRVVFGCSCDTLRKFAGDQGSLLIPCREIFKHAYGISPRTGETRDITVIGPVLEDEAREVHEAYWKKK